VVFEHAYVSKRCGIAVWIGGVLGARASLGEGLVTVLWYFFRRGRAGSFVACANVEGGLVLSQGFGSFGRFGVSLVVVVCECMLRSNNTRTLPL
jgi:hypothetical protein